MPQILFDQTRIDSTELLQHSDLINNILSRTLRYPNVKKLKGAKYNNEDVFRAKTDKKNRLIYTYLLHNEKKTLLVLALNDHNYGQVKRQLRSKNSGNIEAITIDDDPYKEAPEPTSGNLSLLPAVSYNKLTLALDDSQQNAMLQKTPLILNGPPGAGKTVILYNLMLKILNYYSLILSSNWENTTAEQSVVSPVLFISQSDNLITALKEQYKSDQLGNSPNVLFSTWQGLLTQHHPDLKLIPDHEFSLWLKDKMPKVSSDVIHYEFSLIVALGINKYLNLGNRQCYYSKNPEMQNKLINLLDLWQLHLNKHQLLDPMVTRLNSSKNLKFLSVFCDEAQNLPPVALCDLIVFAEDQHFVACLDNEQCLISSPYILSCLKELMHQYYGAYSEQPLPKTWRCRPKVAEVANTLMQVKYTLDGGSKRRNYHAIESMHASGGLVSWINTPSMEQIREFGALTSTVVIAEHLDPGERAIINKNLNTNNILTAREAIGLDFDRVILWRPFSSNKCFNSLLQKIKKPDNTELTLEQWNTLNALYVSITRSQSDVFVHEISTRWIELGEHFLGKLPHNEVSTSLKESKPENELLKWEQVIEHHLAEGRISVARELMQFHLKLDSTAIDEKINARSSIHTQTDHPAPAPAPAQADILPQKKEQPNVVVPKEKNTAGTSVTSSSRKKNKKKNIQPKVEQSDYRGKPEDNEKNSVSIDISPVHKPSIAAVKPSNISPYDTYISLLLIKLNEQSIINLFKHKSAAKLLFQHRLNDGTCLFTKLINNAQFSDFIIQQVNKHWSVLSKAFTPDILCQCDPPQDIPSILILALHNEGRLILKMILNCHSTLAKDIKLSSLTYIPISNTIAHHNLSALYWLLAYIEGRKFVNRLLELNPELGKELDDQFLNYSPEPKPTETLELVPPMYWISSSTTGLTLLAQLIAQNPNLGKTITGKTLCIVRKQTNSDETSSSAFYWLTSSAQGRAILNLLLDLNPELAQQLTAKALCRPLSYNAQIFSNVSGLFWLLSTGDGRALLNKLLTLNPNLAKGITAEALCRRRTVAMGKNAHHSPLSYAANTLEGIALINRLLDLNPEIAKNINADSIYYAFQQREDDHSNTSIFFVLAGTAEGRELLIRLVDANPDLAKKLTGKNLYMTLSSKAHSDPNTSPIFWLTGSAAGRILLSKLLDSNPNLAKEITAEELSRICTSPNQMYVDASPLFWLCGQKDGRDILKRLIEFNPEIAKRMTADALCHIISLPNDPECHSSPLFWLAANPDGRELLNQLLDLNPELAKTISSKALYLISPLNAITLPGTSTLFWLLTDPKGIDVLTKIYKTQPSLVHSVTKETLCTARPKNSTGYTNISSLCLFAENTRGQMLFYQMLTKNPALAQSVTAETLCLLTDIEDNSTSAISAFHWFSSTSCGRHTLLKLLDNNSELAQGITASALCNKRGPDIGKFANTSAFFWLSSTTEGHKILKIILDKNPEMAKEITEDLLCLKCNLLTQELHKSSPLEMLLQSSDGEQFLNLLVHCNPNLDAVIQKQKTLNSAMKLAPQLSFFPPADNQINNTNSSVNQPHIANITLSNIL
ncbi:hypothetical protein [Legionella bononiensis]|uniref:Ankyrin repeats (3 copies) n=1 Tax=Legionella bononiensis TaxID=2793102 RepID=A0ABS1W8H5_9GAMM|nr:hypothetical protein [Legionella bononiensis]MBL7479846.1 hypothetical protein [Legionella bononiensis]MBL7525639.1 hypothetical protein [Legionella bononiensis]MBL7561822.1 hypothetical protein [Legionella bononiensis]